MMDRREDAICPACSDPDTAFRLKDVGLKSTTEGDYLRDDSVTVTFSRPAWEVVMLDHLRFEAELGDVEHQRVYGECMAALLATGKIAEDAARDQVDAVAGFHRRMVDEMTSVVELDRHLDDWAIPDVPFPSAFKVRELAEVPEMTAWLSRVRPERPQT